ncbi:MAG: cytidine deaminase [Candidatus Marinimicrobia bacterium]|nr:cytidine deaminase [Candidatus Neomarinimicrobiota bacterium]MBL7046993.1 cytidine deaminase [Candidatus Neomarinimicrobiota bacterium]
MKTIIRAAQEVKKNAYVPYSHYKVGAAVETEDGHIVVGCNVESSSFGLTVCGERVALTSAIAQGYKSFTSIAIATDDGASPCGACRQVIWDLCGDIPIILIDKKGGVTTLQSRELLPHPFDDSSFHNN